MANKTAEPILTTALRKVRFEGWERGKEQNDTPTDYTLSDESYPKEVFAEASRQLYEAEMQRIGDDDTKHDKRCFRGDEWCVCGTNEVNRTKAELRAKARAFYGITETEGSAE